MMEKSALKSNPGKEEEKRRRFFVFFLYGRIRSYLTSTSSFFVHQFNDDGIDWSNDGGNCGCGATPIPLGARDVKSFFLDEQIEGVRLVQVHVSYRMYKRYVL